MTTGVFTTSITIGAPPETVFDHWTNAAAIVRWMGDHATLVAETDGEFSVDINGVPVRGRYLELDPPHRLLLSWGHAGSDTFPPGSSLVEVILTPIPGGTRLELRHEGIPPAQADQHRLGWDHFLARLEIASCGGDPGRDPWASVGPA